MKQPKGFFGKLFLHFWGHMCVYHFDHELSTTFTFHFSISHSIHMPQVCKQGCTYTIYILFPIHGKSPVIRWSDHRQKFKFWGGDGQNCLKMHKNWGGDGQNCIKTHTTKWTTGGDMSFFHVWLFQTHLNTSHALIFWFLKASLCCIYSYL